MTAGEKKAGIHYGWLILVLAVLTVTGALGFARFGYTMLYPSMQKGLSLDVVQASDLQAGNMIGYLLLALFCGLLATKFGPRIVISIFLVIVALAMLLTGFAGDYPGAFASRVLTGMGSAGANVPVMGLVSAWFAPRRRGLATGIAVSGSSFGLFFTGSFIPPLLAAFPQSGWRYSWFALSVSVLIIAITAFSFIKNNPAKIGLVPIGSAGDKDVKTPGPSTSKIGWGSIIKSFPVWHLAFIYVLFGFSYIIYMTFYVPYLSSEALFSREQAGFYLALVGGFSIASGLLWGWVSDKIGRKYSLAIVFALQAASFILFGITKTQSGIIASSVLFALTAWSIPAIMAATTGDLLGPRLAPATLGFITFFFGIGQVAGPFTAGRIAQATGSFGLAFVIAGCAALTGAIASLTIRNRTASPESTENA